MIVRSTRSTRRRGVIAPLLALLMILLVGMAAFSTDISYNIKAQEELQTMVDAAALAAGQSLGSNYLTSSVSKMTVTTAEQQATAAAQRAGYGNTVAGQNIQLASTDIAYSYTGSGSGTYGWPNTVTVTKSTSVSSFFGGVFGMKTQTLQATAAMVLNSANFNSVNPNSGGYIIPFVYNQSWYQQYVQSGNDPNGNQGTYNGSLSNDQTENVLTISPDKISNTNSSVRGWMSLNFSSSSQGSDIKNWIQNGVSSSDIQSMISNNGLPLYNHFGSSNAPSNSDPSQYSWSPFNGNKKGLLQDFPAGTDQVWLMPLYLPDSGGDPIGGTIGGNGFNVVQFEPVYIISAGISGLQIIPAPSYPNNFIFEYSTPSPGTSYSAVDTSNPPPNSGSGLSGTTYVAPRLIK